MKYIKSLILIILFSPSTLFSMHNTNPFINFGILKKFNKNFSLNSSCEYERYSDTRGNYLHGEIGGIYRIVPKYISSNIAYRAVSFLFPNSRTLEQRIYFNVNFENQINKFGVADQVGFEYRERQNCKDLLFLKNQFTLNFELEKHGKSSIKPYISDILLYDINKVDSHRNILAVGITSNHQNKVLIDFYYYLYSYIKRFNQPLKYENYYGIQFTFLIPEKKRTFRPPKITKFID